MTASTMTSKGQFTLPQAIREELGLKPGDKIDFRVKDGKLQAEIIRKPTVAELAGCLARPGQIYDETAERGALDRMFAEDWEQKQRAAARG